MPNLDEEAEVRFFGANPTIVAEISEIERVASTLRAVSDAIESSKAVLTAVWIQDPGLMIHAAAIGRDLEGVQQLAENLASDCDFAAREYLSAETQAVGLFSRYSDSLPLGAEFRALLTASLGGAALGGIGTPLGSLSLRAMASTALPNRGLADLPEIAARVAVSITGAKITEIPEPASVSLASNFSGSCPTGVASAAERLSELGRGEFPQIRIDAVGTASNRTFFVYLPGTQSWAFGGQNPLDMQSNLLAMGGPGMAASEAAAISALGMANFKSSDKLVLIGHSQGGLLAKNLAVTYPRQVEGVVTFGAPILASELTSAPALVFEHSNDPVPALAGVDTKYPNNALIVTRQFPGSVGTQSHQMESYLETARVAGLEDSTQLAEIERKLFAAKGPTQSPPCQSWVFRISREDGEG